MARKASGRVPGWVEPMLAKPDADRLRSGPKWIYEYKLDGYRCCMRVAADGSTVLTSRNGSTSPMSSPSWPRCIRVGPGAGRWCWTGRSSPTTSTAASSSDSCRSAGAATAATPRRARRFEDIPVRFLVFDLPALGETPLLNRPLHERRERLAAVPTAAHAAAAGQAIG